MESKSEKVASGAQEGLQRGPDEIQERFWQEVAPRDFKKKVIFLPPLGVAPTFQGVPKSNCGVQGSKNTAKFATSFHDVFEVAHKSGKVDKTM